MGPLKGDSTQPEEPGVRGDSEKWNGVFGVSRADGHAGVAGVNDEGNGPGVFARSEGSNGVLGVSRETGFYNPPQPKPGLRVEAALRQTLRTIQLPYY